MAFLRGALLALAGVAGLASLIMVFVRLEESFRLSALQCSGGQMSRVGQPNAVDLSFSCDSDQTLLLGALGIGLFGLLMAVIALALRPAPAGVPRPPAQSSYYAAGVPPTAQPGAAGPPSGGVPAPPAGYQYHQPGEQPPPQ
ncbi:hypothetical protein [Actinoalloteichus spitiensis]|uniref:hypothetical protein n=1 Tax=Actinoalloteichus spitiensis TaxID=252394 RepID=UPI00037DD78A|nr:hypothetical protein [Actinoalloteichus spitiensis]